NKAAPTARRVGALVATFALFAFLPGIVEAASAADFVVTSTVDAVDNAIGDTTCASAVNGCTLRAAIQEANSSPGADTISLQAPPLVAGESPRYNLTIPGRGEAAAATGDLDITQPVDIFGYFNPLPIIDGQDIDRVLDITCGSCLVGLFDLGVFNGGAGTAPVDLPDGNGGGIRNGTATLELYNVGVIDNEAAASGGGIANAGGSVSVLEGTVVAENLTGHPGSGAGVANLSGSLALDDAWVLDNHATCGSGAGIYNAGTLSVHDVLFENNVADCEAGGISNVAGGSATITDSTFSDNLADDGAGMSNGGTATVSRSTFTGNDAFFAFGGALVNFGTLTVQNSTLTGNHAEYRGGAIYSGAGSATLSNVTVSSNAASKLRGGGGFPPNTGEGGGIYIEAGTVTLKNSILAGNTKAVAGTVSQDNCAGSPVGSTGGNLDSGATCGFPLSNANPLLGSLQNNGGLTFTQALGSGSPAIDGGDNSGCPGTDQRGSGRPNDGNGDGSAVCDIGAYEAPTGSPPSGGGGGGPIPDLKLVGSVNPAQAPVGSAVTFVLSASTANDAMAQNVVVTVNVPAGLTITGSSANRGSGCGPVTGGVLTCNLDFLAGGAAKTGTITIGATIAQAGEHTLTASVKSSTGEKNAADNLVTLKVSTPPVVAPTPPTPAGPKAPVGKKLTGNNRANTLRGGAGPDVLNGLGGNDRLYGLAGNDRLLGGLGSDLLVGGLGRDTLLGGAGNDRIESRDGVRDQVSCGAGKRDLVIADRKDIVARDCETVRRR
ncbi:MAG: hypothetical protein QOF68_3006, partial [Gaiellales bacterium]|nr:hypothetical protein [Gaiellales bacterium]